MVPSVPSAHLRVVFICNVMICSPPQSAVCALITGRYPRFLKPTVHVINLRRSHWLSLDFQGCYWWSCAAWICIHPPADDIIA